MNRQVVLLASSSESNITAWDLNTGTLLTSYKANASPRNGMVCLGGDYLLAAQTGKDSIQFWTWHKDHVLQRCFTLERMAAIAASQDGAFIAGGGVSGSLYLWEVASGRLLRSWPAHYKGVSALSFLESGTVLISGGEDTRVCSWLLSDLLDISLDTSSPLYLRPQPLYCWSEHTLPITSVCCGIGESNALIVTSSLDRTCKLHSMADGRLLRTVSFPVSIHCVTMDAGEHSLYAGGGDGTLFEVSLLNNSGEPSEGGAAAAAGGAAGLWKAAGTAQHDSGYHRMEGHSRAINCLSVASDGEHMVTGSDDGTAFVWDLRSRQSTQAIQSPSKLPVTSVQLIPQPHHLSVGSGAAATGGGGRQGPKRPQPLAPLVKFPGMNGTLKPWEGPCVVVSGVAPFGSIMQAVGEAANEAAAASGSSSQAHQASGCGGDGQQQPELARLQTELEKARASADKWQSLYKSSMDSMALMQGQGH